VGRRHRLAVRIEQHARQQSALAGFTSCRTLDAVGLELSLHARPQVFVDDRKMFSRISCAGAAELDPHDESRGAPGLVRAYGATPCFTACMDAFAACLVCRKHPDVDGGFVTMCTIGQADALYLRFRARTLCNVGPVPTGRRVLGPDLTSPASNDVKMSSASGVCRTRSLRLSPYRVTASEWRNGVRPLRVIP